MSYTKKFRFVHPIDDTFIGAPNSFNQGRHLTSVIRSLFHHKVPIFKRIDSLILMHVGSQIKVYTLIPAHPIKKIRHGFHCILAPISISRAGQRIMGSHQHKALLFFLGLLNLFLEFHFHREIFFWSCPVINLEIRIISDDVKVPKTIFLHSGTITHSKGLKTLQVDLPAQVEMLMIADDGNHWPEWRYLGKFLHKFLVLLAFIGVEFIGDITIDKQAMDFTSIIRKKGIEGFSQRFIRFGFNCSPIPDDSQIHCFISLWNPN
jgi:hypothetical protein